MTTLAPGSSVTLTAADGCVIGVATNGGLCQVIATQTTGEVQTVNLGPLPERRKFGPFSEGASVVIANMTATALDYDYPNGGGDGLTARQLEALQALVSGAGNGPLYRKLLDAFSIASVHNTLAGGVMAAPPTITSPGTAPSPSTPLGFWQTNGASRMRTVGITGGDAKTNQFLRQYATNYLIGYGPHVDANATPGVASTSWWLEFVTDAPLFTFQAQFCDGSIANSPKIYMAVGSPNMTGMQLTSASGHAAATANSSFTVDWSGTRKMRGYRLYLSQTNAIGLFSIGQDDTMYAPRWFMPTVLDIGDSYVADTLSPAAHSYYALENQTREISGCNLIGHGIGSSGYTTGNILGNAWRISDAALAGASLIRVLLGVNDAGASATRAATRAAAAPALAQLRASVGSVPIEVKGPFGRNLNLSETLLGVEAGIAQAVADLGDPLMAFTPSLTASETCAPEVTGAKDTATGSGATGNSLYMTGDDHTHPSIAGAAYIASRRWMETVETVRSKGW